jgi:hypothetical protein
LLSLVRFSKGDFIANCDDVGIETVLCDKDAVPSLFHGMFLRNENGRVQCRLYAGHVISGRLQNFGNSVGDHLSLLEASARPRPK